MVPRRSHLVWVTILLLAGMRGLDAQTVTSGVPWVTINTAQPADTTPSRLTETVTHLPTDAASTSNSSLMPHPDILNTTESNVSSITLHQLMLIRYYELSGLGRPCYDQLSADGYFDQLDMLEQMCVCILLACDMVGYELTPEEVILKEELERESAEEIKDKVLSEYRYSAENLPKIVGVGVSYGLIMVVGIIGNILVLVTVARYMGRPTVTNIMIASISAGDLMILFIVLPFQLMYQIYGFWELGEPFCKTIAYFYFVSFSCSSLSLLAMSVERYIVICHPMKAQSVSTTGRAKKIVVVVWIIALLVAAPAIPMMKTNINTCVVNFTDFTYVFTFYALTVGVVFVLPSLVMLWAYTSVSISLWKSIALSKSLQNKKAEGNGEKKSDEETAHERIKVIRMLVSLVVVFIICWGPYWGVRLRRAWSSSGYNTFLVSDLGVGFQTLSFLNSALNPILYAFISRPFRRGFRRACCCYKDKHLPGDSSYVSRTISTIATSSSSHPA